MKRMNVKVACTTDDPVDNLEHHRKIAAGNFCFTRVLPAFRPDKAMSVEDPDAYNNYLQLLEQAADISIVNLPGSSHRSGETP